MTPPTASRRHFAMGWLVATVLLVALVGADRIGWWKWRITPRHNINLEEALAWHRGTFELQGPQREGAVVEGRRYNPFPPAFTFISYIVTGIQHSQSGRYEFNPWVFRLLLGPPVVLLAWWAARGFGLRPWQAMVLTISLVLGTPIFIMLVLCRIGGFFEVNHLLACCGLLLIAGDLLGRQRLWPALIGLAIAFWSRQLTGVFALWILWAAAQKPPAVRSRWIKGVLLFFALLAGVYGVLNTLKFGSPLESGYRHIYAHRKDPIAQRAKLGLFHPKFIGDNARYLFREPPGVRLTSRGVVKATNDFGAAIWMTCPILVGVVLTAHRWWRDKGRRAGMLCSLVVLGALLMYHNTGWRQPGYYRFCLDFVPVWILVIAPFVWTRIGTPLVIAATVWSVWYFRFIAPTDFSWAGV